MFHSQRASALAIVCLLPLTVPALAGSNPSPMVIQGVGPGDPSIQEPEDQAGRYGGGFVEFLMTGHSAPSRSSALPHPGVAMALAEPTPSAEPDYSGEPEPSMAPLMRPQPGYAAPRKAVDPMFVKQDVPFAGPQAPGSIVIDTTNKFLYLVEAGGHALRYGIGVGRPGFLWSGEKTITRKAEWPDWTPPAEMIKRRPDLPSHMDGGITNPLGARAMYLGSSLYRIHGTNEPDTIGTNVSSGCIRLTNDDVSDLFGRVRVGTHVFVM